MEGSSLADIVASGVLQNYVNLDNRTPVYVSPFPDTLNKQLIWARNIF